MNRLILILLTVVAIGAGTFGAMQMSTADDLLAQLNDSKASLEKLQAELAKAQAALRELDAAREGLANITAERDRLAAENKDLMANAQKNAGIVASGQDASKQGGQQGKFDMQSMARGFFKSMDDPNVRKAMMSGQEQMIGRFYGKLFEQMGLDEQTSKLATEIINERNFAALQKGRKLMEAGVTDENMAQVRKDVEAVKAEHDAKLKAVLGEEQYKQFTSYEQTVGDRRALDSFTRDFERGGAPLEDKQREALSKVMAEERMKSPVNEIPDMGGGPGMAILYSDAEAAARQKQEEEYANRVVSRAPEAGLSPQQVSTLQDSFKQRSARQVMSRTMGRLFLGGGGGGGGR